MLLSILKVKKIIQAITLVPERHRQYLSRSFFLHRLLIIFFFFGYVIVLLAFIFDVQLVSQLFVSVIFLLGAVFVLMGIVIQSRLLSEIQTTLNGLLPICAKCKKIPINEDDIENPKSWKNIESYISERSDVNFSHGLCPSCFKLEMETLYEIKNK